MPEGLETMVLGDIPSEVPTEWEEVGTVDKLYIYPCKSTRGILVPEAKATKGGLCTDLCADRQFMIVDSDQKYISAPRFPKMALMEVNVKKAKDSEQLILTLSAPAEEKLENLEVDLPDWDSTSEGLVNSSVLGADVQGLDLGIECGRWVSQFLVGDTNAGFRMIGHKGRVPNPRHGDKLFPRIKEDYSPFYANRMPYLLFSKETVDGLNQRLKDRDVDLVVEERRFRPNIFVKDVSGPFAEDSWTYIKINDAVLVNASRCKRCPHITIDPNKGEKDPRREPSETLRTYRASLNPDEKKKFGTSPFFGINLGLEKGGTIKVGDKVFVGRAA